MEKQITHKQHYVWREYLKPWGVQKNDKVFVWWNNHKCTKCTDVFDILREKDFYEYKPLNKLELFYLNELFVKTNSALVEEANSPIKELVDIISSMDKKYIETEQMKNILIQAGEDVQSNIEKMGAKYITALKQSDLSLFNYGESGEMIDFLLFLLFQFFRTKCNRENVVNAFSGDDEKTKELYRIKTGDNNEYNVDWNKIYNLGYVFSINQISYVLAHRMAHIKLMKADNIKFIVSDQPVYNVANDVKKDFDLFYPISPDIAVVVSCNYSNNHIVTLTDEEVLCINQKTIKNASKFIIGISKEYVEFNWKADYS